MHPIDSRGARLAADRAAGLAAAGYGISPAGTCRARGVAARDLPAARRSGHHAENGLRPRHRKVVRLGDNTPRCHAGTAGGTVGRRTIYRVGADRRTTVGRRECWRSSGPAARAGSSGHGARREPVCRRPALDATVIPGKLPRVRAIAAA